MSCHLLLPTTALLLMLSALAPLLPSAAAKEDLDYFEVRVIVKETLEKATSLSASMSDLPAIEKTLSAEPPAPADQLTMAMMQLLKVKQSMDAIEKQRQPFTLALDSIRDQLTRTEYYDLSLSKAASHFADMGYHLQPLIKKWQEIAASLASHPFDPHSAEDRKAAAADAAKLDATRADYDASVAELQQGFDLL